MRRLLLSLLLCLLVSAPAYANVSSRVQGCHSSVSSTAVTTNCTLGATPTAGNVVCVALFYFDTGGGNAGTVTGVDSGAKVYTLTPNSPSAARQATSGPVYLLYLVVPSGAGSTVTLAWTTVNAGLFAADMWVVEFAVTGGTVAFNADVAGTGTTGTAINTPTVTAAATNSLMFAASLSDHTVSTVDSPWTAEAQGSGNPLGEGLGYILSVGSNTAVAMTQNTSSGWDSIGMSFTFTASGGGGCVPTMTLLGVGRCGH